MGRYRVEATFPRAFATTARAVFPVLRVFAATASFFCFAHLVVAGEAASPSAPAASAGPAPTGKADAAGAHGVAIVSTKASWDNLSELFLSATPAAPFSEGSVFVIRGELRNDGELPFHHAVLRYELLDDDGKVVAEAEGYNRRAEAMRPDEEGKVRSDEVEPVAAGATDSYRMVFFHDEVPKFASHRVRVVEVHAK